ATTPTPGIIADVFDTEGNSVEPGNGGYLVITKRWPSMLRTVRGDDARFQNSYFREYEAIYTSSDAAHKDEYGYILVLDLDHYIINVSRHRLGAIEIESAVVSHDLVAEAAVIGRSDELKGEAVTAFVTLKERATSSEELRDEIKAK